MTYFILQTLFWLLLSFIIGLILGRWLKRLLCRKGESGYNNTATTYATEKGVASDAAYTRTADKLAFRDRGEYDSQPSERSDVSVGTAAAGVAAAAAGATVVSRSLDDNVDNDIDISLDSQDSEDISTTTTVTSVDVETEEGHVHIDQVELDLEVDEIVDTDVVRVEEDDAGIAMRKERQAEIDIAWEDASDDVVETTDSAETIIETDVASSDDADDVIGSEEEVTEEGVIGGIAAAGAGLAASVTGDVEIDDSSTIDGVDSNNLQIIEGIGPKMQEILNENGVYTWKDLSLKSETDLRAMLDKYGDQYKGVEDLDSWIVQARLAADGDVDELIRVQKVDGSSKLERKFGITGSGASKGTDASLVDEEEAVGGESALSGVAGAVTGVAAQGLMGSADDADSLASSGRQKGIGIPGIEGDDNLQIIEGIGPAMEKVLKENGVNSWSDLASKSEVDVQAILDKYGDKYRLMQPASWITEAKLAATGNVDELIRVQKVDGVSKLENMMGGNAKGGFSAYQRNDLEIVEGIGPKVAELLNAAGINSWNELANADVNRLQSILDAGGAGFQMANPATWAEQANMADKGEWAELKEYQDFLEGGVVPTAASAQGFMGSTDDSSDSSSGQSGSAIPGIDSDSNLQIIEGIGPAMEKVLQENGVNTWSDLASKSTADVQAILDKYGDKYKLMQPASWIAEAELAAAGDVAELIRLQKIDGISKLENLLGATMKGGFGAYQKNDLEIVEGIGPKIAGLLNDAGINSWNALSNMDSGDIQGILDKAGSDFQMADPSTWAEQAGLADRGEWDKLKEYQDFLDGGRV